MRPRLKNKTVNKENEQRPISLTLEDIARIAKEVGMEHGGHVAMIVAEGSRRSVVGQLPEFAGTHEGRARQMFAAGFTLAKSGEIGVLRQVFFVSEAWMSAAKEGKLPGVPPSQDPNRKEVLIITSLKLAGQQTGMVILEMVRDAQGRLADLRDFQRTEGGEERVESPLLSAFVQGFRAGGKVN